MSTDVRNYLFLWQDLKACLQKVWKVCQLYRCILTQMYHFFSVDRWRLHLSAGLSERVGQVCQPPSGSPIRTTDWLTTANHLRWVNVWTQLRSSELILALVSLLLENSMATKLIKKGLSIQIAHSAWHSYFYSSCMHCLEVPLLN